jgi:hypothetical protein
MITRSNSLRRFAEALAPSLDQLRELLGDHWPRFQVWWSQVQRVLQQAAIPPSDSSGKPDESLGLFERGADANSGHEPFVTKVPALSLERPFFADLPSDAPISAPVADRLVGDLIDIVVGTYAADLVRHAGIQAGLSESEPPGACGRASQGECLEAPRRGSPMGKRRGSQGGKRAARPC